jgi:quercetin dioxygenase-like cupin family protein
LDIKRFGPGYRKPDGPPGTLGVSGQVIFRDERATVSELAFQRFAIITPHTNATNAALFIVISGAGYVQVGDERARINHGEAVEWPAGVPHGAYTDGTEMRAIIVELEGAPATIHAAPVADTTQRPPATRAEGGLADRQAMRDDYDSAEGEPW